MSHEKIMSSAPGARELREEGGPEQLPTLLLKRELPSALTIAFYDGRAHE